MPTENNKVFATGPGVFLAAGANFEEIADQAVIEQAFQMNNRGSKSHMVGNRGFDLVLLSGGNHGIGFSEGHGQRLLEVNMGSDVRGRAGHFEAVLDPVGTN